LPARFKSASSCDWQCRAPPGLNQLNKATHSERSTISSQRTSKNPQTFWIVHQYSELDWTIPKPAVDPIGGIRTSEVPFSAISAVTIIKIQKWKPVLPYSDSAISTFLHEILGEKKNMEKFSDNTKRGIFGRGTSIQHD
ncbi:hypothetical protein FRC04_009385, partial [Tulasnella sp. 424]